MSVFDDMEFKALVDPLKDDLTPPTPTDGWDAERFADVPITEEQGLAAGHIALQGDFELDSSWPPKHIPAPPQTKQ